MKESYSEILARNTGPESYAERCKILGVVTTGVHPGPASELRKHGHSECRHHRAGGRQHHASRYWRDLRGFGGVEDLEHGWKPQTREPGGPMSPSGLVTDGGPKTPQEVQRT